MIWAFIFNCKHCDWLRQLCRVMQHCWCREWSKAGLISQFGQKVREICFIYILPSFLPLSPSLQLTSITPTNDITVLLMRKRECFSFHLPPFWREQLVCSSVRDQEQCWCESPDTEPGSHFHFPSTWLHNATAPFKLQLNSQRWQWQKQRFVLPVQTLAAFRLCPHVSRPHARLQRWHDDARKTLIDRLVTTRSHSRGVGSCSALIHPALTFSPSLSFPPSLPRSYMYSPDRAPAGW